MTNAQPAQRPYTPPALVIHGDVRTLTLQPGAIDADLAVAASFLPPTSGGHAPSGL